MASDYPPGTKRVRPLTQMAIAGHRDLGVLYLVLEARAEGERVAQRMEVALTAEQAKIVVQDLLTALDQL